MDFSLADISRRFGLSNCDRCGTCAAVCPMREVYPGFARRYAPRTTIARLNLSGALNGKTSFQDIIDDAALWMCLSCEACLNTCPQGVQFRDFVEHLREKALEFGFTDRFAACSRCGRPYLPKLVVEALGQYLPDEDSRELVTTCPRCRRRQYSKKLLPQNIQ